MSVLSAEIRKQYAKDGFVQIHGLIPDDMIDRAALTLLALHNADKDALVNRTGAVHKAYEHPDLRAVYTSSVYETIAELIGDKPENLVPPTIPYSIIIPPVTDSALTEYAHIDWMNAESRTDPGFRITVMIYLSDVELGGGGTYVWPGSSERVRLLATDYESYQTHADLADAITSQRLTFGEPVETTPSKGDVVFIDSWMVHAWRYQQK